MKFIAQGKHALYNFIHENKKTYPIGVMCEVLGASTSTYNLWTVQPVSKSEARVRLLKETITSIFDEFKQRYGCILITRELHKKELLSSKVRSHFTCTSWVLEVKSKRNTK